MSLLVRHLMRPTLITCPATATLGEVAVQLVRQRVHALFVIDTQGQPLGLLSDIDLLAGEWLSTGPDSLARMRAMTAGELMSTPLKAIEAEAPAGEAAHQMRQEGIHRLLVIEGGRPVGVISVSDIVANLGHAAVERRTVAEVMSRGLFVCREETPLVAVARAMTQHRSRSMVVVGETGQPLGIVTGIDLLAFDEQGLEHQTVSQVMRSPIAIPPTATLPEAADMMIQRHIHRLLVVDPDHPHSLPLGLISTSDIVAEMAERGSVWQEVG
jgi:CBS domain-containing protein